MAARILLFSSSVDLADDFRDWCDYFGHYLMTTDSAGRVLAELDAAEPNLLILDADAREYPKLMDQLEASHRALENCVVLVDSTDSGDKRYPPRARIETKPLGLAQARRLLQQGADSRNMIQGEPLGDVNGIAP